MKNLKTKRLEFLKRYDKGPKDIKFVTDGKKWTTFETFLELADFPYDSGYGGNVIYLGLKIVGKGFWLGRREYDGSEWWEYSTTPIKPEYLSNKITIKGDWQ